MQELHNITYFNITVNSAEVNCVHLLYTVQLKALTSWSVSRVIPTLLTCFCLVLLCFVLVVTSVVV